MKVIFPGKIFIPTPHFKLTGIAVRVSKRLKKTTREDSVTKTLNITYIITLQYIVVLACYNSKNNDLNSKIYELFARYTTRMVLKKTNAPI